MEVDKSKQPSEETLLEYAETERQRQAIKAWFKNGKVNARAAQELGIGESSFRNLMTRVRMLAAMQGYSPEHNMNKVVPDPMAIKRISTFYNANGSINQWVIAEPDKQQLLELMRAVVDELKTDVDPLQPIRERADAIYSPDLLNLFVLTDAHIGMLAWHEEGGANWDLKIAEETINAAFDHLICCSPVAETAFFCQLGDGLHTDSMVPVTPTSGHVLDADGRYQKVVRTAVRIFRRNINRLLETHKRVVVLLAAGNHDPSGSVWLQEMFSTLYEDNPRVEIICSPLPYYAYRHGEVLLGFHHGHMKKVPQLPEVFVGEFRHLLGATKQTYLHTGHLHSKVVETNSTIVEQHATLAARDAYSAYNGYRSMRTMQAITYHKTRQETGRTVYRP